MNPCFYPVMIRGHGDEEGQEYGKCQIAAVIPIELVEGHGADEADEENRQSPSGERCAGAGSLNNEAVGAADDSLDLDDA